MVKLILLFLIFLGFKTLAQQPKPIAESNYFVYNKYNYGYDIPNPTRGAIDDKGRFWIKPYTGKYRIVENAKIKEPYLPNINQFPEIDTLFTIGKKQYLCTSGNIFVFKNDSLVQNIPVAKNQWNAGNFIFHQNKIYYKINRYYNNENTNIIYYYDFKNSYKIYEIKGQNVEAELYKIKKKLYINSIQNFTSTVFEINNHQLKKEQTLKFAFNNMIYINYLGSLRDYIIFNHQAKEILEYKNHQVIRKEPYPNDYNYYANRYFLTNKDQIQGVFKLTNLKQPIFSSFYQFNLNFISYNKFTNSYFAGNGGQLIRFFPYVKKYPKFFNDTNSAQVFTMAQTPDSTKWFGSYNGFLTILKNGKLEKSPTKNLRFLNGNLNIRNQLLLFSEGNMGNYLFSSPSQYQKILDKNVFFYGFRAKSGKYYLGSMGEGLFQIEPEYFETFDKKSIKIINADDGMKLKNILTISDDKFGNIWMGQKGIAVYNPRKNKTITWHYDDDPKYFRTVASLQDSYKTLWVGTFTGELAFYDGKNADDLDFKNFKKITHPLLKNNSNPISFLHQWKNFLVIGANDRILLFDLEQWHHHKKIVVRYLNPQETNFSAPTEQNTVFTDKKDESIWFATSDMVYQWDIKNWLKLPVSKIKPNLIIRKDSFAKSFNPNEKISFEPTENSFDFEVHYQSQDNLPRYLNCALVKKGEKPEFDFPNLQTSFHFANLSSGDYIFYVRVCQQDGSFEVFEYPVFIDSFLWQKWWFWTLIFLISLGFIFYYFRKKSELEQTQKKLSQLNLVSLSNQFRPHFMLNALNSIASQMGELPYAEKIISKLGESINLLYDFSQKNEFTHDFSDEWKLVENFIEIQKTLYLPELELNISHLEIMSKTHRVPVGLLQIPVENALLHGLRNKESGPYQLAIDFSEIAEFYEIKITDNGIGRKQSEKIHEIKKNGKGLKTVMEMIAIINRYTANSIRFDVIDLENNAGTQVVIRLKKNTDYGKIKL